jgi:hypothetical protein
MVVCLCEIVGDVFRPPGDVTGPSTGMRHSMMVTNLIRSVHFFSKHPIVVFVVGTPELSVGDPLLCSPPPVHSCPLVHTNILAL